MSDQQSGTSSAVAPGDVLAEKYRVDRVLGEGGMGVVVAATHLHLDERVALKFMLPDALKAPGAKERFLREARAAVKLKSEHVAKVLDVGTLGSGAPYIVMEFLDGMDVAEALARAGKLSPGEACDYVIQACDALLEAHGLGIVHRDLKPANLFVARRTNGDPLVKVLDFGISKTTLLSDSADALTKSSVMLGSPLYMSPEQMKSSRDVDTRSDIWSLGVILYELLSGEVPFNGDTIGALMAKVLVESPRPLEGVPPGLSAIVSRCLARDVSERFADVRELAVALAEFALPRSQLLVERMRPSLPTSTTSDLGLAKTLAQPAPVSANTGSSWGATAGAEAPRKRLTKAPIVVGAVALAALAVVAVVELRGGSQKDPLPGSPPAVTVLNSGPAATLAPLAPTLIPIPSASAAVTAAAPPPTAVASVTHVARPVPPPSVTPSSAPSSSASAKKKGVLDDWN